MKTILVLANQKHVLKQHISLEPKIPSSYIFIIQILYGDLINFQKIIRSLPKTSTTIILIIPIQVGNG